MELCVSERGNDQKDDDDDDDDEEKEEDDVDDDHLNSVTRQQPGANKQ